MMSQSSTIPVFRPDVTEQEVEAVAATLRSGWIGAGPRTAEFEQQFGEAMQVRFAISTGTGTAALQAALAGLGTGPGDEIILPAFTWVSAFQVIRSFGATPVFADIEPDYLTIDPQHVAQLISGRTRGILAVHHGGQLADMEALSRLARAHNLWLLDDAAHACGAMYQGRPVGSLADLTCFSFNAVKNLTTGDGGMVTTNDEQLAHRLRLHRSLGIDWDTYSRYEQNKSKCSWIYDVVCEGQRSHMNDIAAAIGLVQLQRLNEMNRKRARLVDRYREAFSDVATFRVVGPRPATQPSHHMCTLRVADRDHFVETMRGQGIRVGVHYIPIHLFSVAQPCSQVLPVTETIWREVATLPVYPGMTDSEQDRVIEAAREFVGCSTARSPAYSLPVGGESL
jgi:perosamine synthetase